MRISTITCHDVYNHGASLQSYSLMKYLQNCGHEVEITDYKPNYLSNHYKLFKINNPKWERHVLSKLIYIILKLPGRLISLKRKREFDLFTSKYLNLSTTRYKSINELMESPPKADVYLCGSDQIWNCTHENGKDPSFYLEFVPKDKVRASYAASFATETIPTVQRKIVKNRIEKLDYVSVRESSALEILEDMKIYNGVHVVDPVFLLDKNEWNAFIEHNHKQDFIVVYDFDKNPLIKAIAQEMKKRTGYKIYSISANKINFADRNFHLSGPETYVSLMKNAKFVISNSFHAAVFSILYEKNFVIVRRNENINTRMRDLLSDLGLGDRLLEQDYNLDEIIKEIDYEKVNPIISDRIRSSKKYLDTVLRNKKMRNVL